MLEWSDRGMSADDMALPSAHGGRWGQAANGRLLVIGVDGDLPVDVDRAAQALHMAGELGSVADVPAFGGGYTAIWCCADAAPDEALLDQLETALNDGGVALLFDVRGAAIDPVWSRFGDRDGVSILAAPDAHDVHAALAYVLAARTMAVHQQVATDHDRQLERLQEEVSRIARTLAKMSEPEARLLIRSPDGSREPPSPFIDDHLRESARGYRAGAPLTRLDNARLDPEPAMAPAVSAREVRRIIRLRRVRDQFFEPELFADPAWDMILDLYAARLEHNRVSVSSLCIAAAVPATTALRWIKALTTSGLFERRADPHDGRRIFVALSDSAAAAMHGYFAAIVDEGAVI
jgi:Winged helix DNA-binding domain